MADEDDLLDELDSENGGDDEADRLLEEMRRLNRDVAAAVNSVEGKTLSFDDESDQMHTKLNAMALDIINDVKLGKSVEDTPCGTLASSSVSAEDPVLAEEMWQPPEMPEMPDPPASSSATATLPSSPARPAAGGGRFKAPQSQVEAKSVVSDISRLASKPLLADSAPMPRRPGGSRGLMSGSTMGRGRGR